MTKACLLQAPSMILYLSFYLVYTWGILRTCIVRNANELGG